MQKISFIVLFLTLLFSQENIAAQDKLSLKEAVTIAIQNSYDIKLVENASSIAKNNNNYGVAGGLPSVTATGTNNNTLTTINQTFPDASRNTTRNGVDGSTLNGGLSATMI
jgi:outer membrane protein TolC